MAQPRVLVLTGYGINCDDETEHYFEIAGADAKKVHINDLIDHTENVLDYQIMAWPGGFSFGDDTGPGNGLANRIRNNYWQEIQEFMARDTLSIGICNGFQVLTNLGLLPAFDGNYGERQVALDWNTFPRYSCRWVDLKFEGDSPWTKDVGTIMLPIAHGQGKFTVKEGSDTLERLKANRQIAARYVPGEITEFQSLPYNPNGSLDDIASITDPSGKIIGMMPHPERATEFTHLPHWTYLAQDHLRTGNILPNHGPGIKILQNGVKYFE